MRYELVKNSVHVVKIDGYNSKGYGIARIDGLAVFVKSALQDEVLRVKLLKVQKNVAYAAILDIITPSAARIKSSCSVFGKCGGCDYLHMEYEEELRLKQQRVKDAVTRIGGIFVEIPPVIGSVSREAYRNKAIFAVGGGENGAVTGFYREHSHDIIPVEKCIIQADASNSAASAVRRWMDKYKIPHYDHETRTGAIRHVFCRYALNGNMLQVAVVSADEKVGFLAELVSEMREACPETASIVLNVNKTDGNTVLAGEFRTIWGADYIEDIMCSLKFRLTPLSFYQINTYQAERIYEEALRLADLSQNDTALDLYCGAGTITLILARNAGIVIGAEIVKEAIECAEANAAQNCITNARFLCADANIAAESFKNSGDKPKTVVVDPPRKGLSKDVIKTITKISPDRVVYISCDPATMARDLADFSGKGYEVRSVAPYDMFPGCAHVECVALLARVT